ncbi:DNA/RNA non-specific endonuclease [Vitiosangium sp. GDMCC 1.1324]|uniref:DNA/RNA non-specific endonuclease n=1 Tax=Vitiosangium sp. (strain GDMCC 1.1324) TaxID=2138576 RepID=UPI000D3CDDCD|nr:DNA/RNA non-specific endonuclease [Vitiosangium sp. GDMCC 1.1324]PTL85201.1 hypothetical protein DAT35_00275 [Vitiosangium sp. GDMCC 1.1324]
MAFEPVRKPSARSSSAPELEKRRKQLQGSVPTTRSRESTLPRYLRDELQQAPSPKTNPKAQPGEIDLSKGVLDASSVRLDEDGRAMARLGSLAAGELELVEGKGGYSTRGQGAALPLSLPPLDGVLGGRLVLAVRIENNVITGHAALGKPGRAVPRNDSALLGLLGKEPEALGLKGLSKLGIKSLHNTLENGVLKLGAESVDFTLSGFVTGSGQLGFENGQMRFGGQAEVKLPGGSGGKLQVGYSPETGLTGETHLEVSIGKVSGGADARLKQGVLDIQGTASYAGDRLKGTITLLATDAATARDITTKDPQAGGLPTPGGEGAPGAGTGAASPSEAGAQAKPGPRAFCGWGELDFSLTEWLTGKAKVVVGSTGEATVRGELAPPKEIILFEQKDWTKSLLKLEARAAYGLPVVGNVFVFANVGLEALATIGPGKLYNIKLSGQYSTDKRVDKELNLQATLNISAFAGLRLRAEGGVGVELLGHDIKAGVGVWALAGVRGYVEATPTIGYRQNAGAEGEFYIQGHMELAAQPFLGLGGDLFVEVDSPWWSPLPDDKWTWPLGSLEYPLPGEFGIGADVEHVLGSKQWPEVKFTEVEFDGGRFMSDLLSQSAPGRSKAGEDHKPAKWDEGGAAGAPAGGKGGAGGKSAAAPAKAPAPGGKKGGKKDASTKPAKGKSATDKLGKKDGEGKPGKEKAGKGQGPEKTSDKLERPVSMAGASHTLFITLGQGAHVEMASKRELLSNKLGRGVGALLQRKRDAERTGDVELARKLQTQADDLKGIGSVAKRTQMEAMKLGTDPKKDLNGTEKGVQPAIFQTLAGEITAYGDLYKVTDLDQLLGGAIAAEVPKTIKVEKAYIAKEKISQTLVTALGKHSGGMLHHGRKLDPKTMVPTLTSSFGATYDRANQLLTLRSPSAEVLGQQESLAGLGASASKQTGASMIDLAKNGKMFTVKGEFGQTVDIAYGESRPALEEADILRIANERLDALLKKWESDVLNSGMTDPSVNPAIEIWKGFTFNSDAVRKPALEFAKTHVLDEHVSSVVELEGALRGRLKASFQDVAGEVAAEQARNHGIAQARDNALQDKLRNKVQYESNGQLGRILTPVSAGEHHEFEPIKIDEVVKGDIVEITYTTRKGQHFVVTFDAKLGLTTSIVGTNLSLKGPGDPKNRGITEDSPHYVANKNLNRSHLIADEFKGSGYKEGLNLITTSDHYNQIEMRRAEKRIGDFIIDNKAITFSLRVDVTWNEILEQTILQKIVNAHWFKTNYKNATDPLGLEQELKAKLAACPNLKQCKRVEYTAIITDAEEPALVNLDFFTKIDEDLWLLLDKK